MNIKRGVSMKASSYNIFVDLDNENKILYNSISGAMVEINGNIYNEVKNMSNMSRNELDECSQELMDAIEDFKKYGIIVEDDLDELELIKVLHYEARNKFNPTLIIYPTLDCIFDCIYCSAQCNRSPQMMTMETEERVIKLTRRLISQNEKVSIGFSGGEPLLCFDTICRIASAARKFTSGKEKQLVISVTTNGYLLTRERALKLRECGINQVAISFDGPPHIHNERRHLYNGAETFDVIMKNLKDAVEIIDYVFILTALDRENIGSFLDLLDIFRDEGLMEKITVIYDPVVPCKNEREDRRTKCFSKNEYSEIITGMNAEIVKRGVQLQPDIAQMWPGKCTGIVRNMLNVSPEGDLYKCKIIVGDKKNSVGSIYDIGDGLNASTLKWLSWDPFKSDECVNCKILPLCMGGCPLNEICPDTDIILEGKTGRECSILKYYIENIIKFKFEHSRGKADEIVKI